MLRQLRRRAMDWMTDPDDASWAPVSTPLSESDAKRQMSDAARDWRRHADRALGSMRIFSLEPARRHSRRADRAWKLHAALASRYGYCTWPGCCAVTEDEYCEEHARVYMVPHEIDKPGRV